MRKLTGSFLRTLVVIWFGVFGFSTCIRAGEPAPPRQPTNFDIVIYGGTASGVIAAVQARELGKSVLIIEPTHRLGGLTTGGLGNTDIGNKHVIGGLARQFYREIRKHYDSPDAWTRERPEDYRYQGQAPTGANEDTMWTFEPSVALAILNRWIHDHEIPVLYGERLDREQGASKVSRRIVSIPLESGKRVEGKMFIDASYEGDLMAAAGVNYTVGREANSTYGETLNGVQTSQAKKHQLQLGIDPYVQPGDAANGLLPGVDPTGPGKEGERDHRVQAYCYRMCLTDDPANRIPFIRPADYVELDYELLFRNFEAGYNGIPWSPGRMPNRKTDTNNNSGFSTDYIGMNYDYAEADYDRRAEIRRQHLRYQQGLMWTLANHPRVPEHVRSEVARWGTCRDEFVESDGWPEQLYIREARRMIGPVVMTQNHCQGRQVADDPVGMAAYTMDSHNVQRYVDAAGQVRNEGDVQVSGFPPYPISYRAIVPPMSECENLLVPVCLSASHIAYGSIRMEPVFMILGQSAATAACLSIDGEVPVQKVNYEDLRQHLRKAGQILDRPPPKQQQSQQQ